MWSEGISRGEEKGDRAKAGGMAKGSNGLRERGTDECRVLRLFRGRMSWDGVQIGFCGV